MATGKKYDRTIEAKYKNENIVTDVYRVLDAFEVKSQPRGHAAKKVLCAGLRGKGDEFNDIVMDSKWSWINQGTSAWTENGSYGAMGEWIYYK